jgi:hypothetical protein
MVATGGVGPTIAGTHGFVNTAVQPAHSFAFSALPFNMALTTANLAPAHALVNYTITPTPGIGTTPGTASGPAVQPAAGLPSAGLTEAQIMAVLNTRLASTDAKLKAIYDLLVLVARKQGIDPPATTSFSATTLSPASERNQAETRRILASIGAKQTAWTASAAESPAKTDPKVAEIRRLLADISATQASWKTSADRQFAASK